MTTLEKFVAFAEALPSERRQEVEDLLADLMAAEGAEGDFTAEELAELDRRLANPNPRYADPKDIAVVSGLPAPR
ncbi:MAG: hypothetical protein P0Y56_12770 [Candidatus Andeanibacterium colombiense]|uniref:Addiction module component n=1 Tax=Candidatus Andeanibacterium colombiense TaxID=3121345 RepID=A0AAJ6BMA1_9SPHN|nr:MAG: hypothetical protein P0Y56_12770 [Sphingomonadaceae bacterium]